MNQAELSMPRYMTYWLSISATLARPLIAPPSVAQLLNRVVPGNSAWRYQSALSPPRTNTVAWPLTFTPAPGALARYPPRLVHDLPQGPLASFVRLYHRALSGPRINRYAVGTR